MDLKGKGITWVGNIYHKFEAIRSEVGDMSKETAKYVENQVQGVGVNVKKICAGVMHDFIPSSSVDPVKEEGSSDISVQENSDLGTCKESMAALDDNPISESVPHKVSEITADMVKGSTPVSFSARVPDNNHLLPPPPVSPVKDVGPEFLLEQNDDFDKHNKSKTGNEEDDVKVDLPQIGVSEVVDPAVEVQSPVFGTQTEMSPQTSVDVTIETFCQNGGDIHNDTLDQTKYVNDSSTALSSSMFVPSFSCENQVVKTGSAPSNSFPTEPNGMDTLTTFEASKNEFEQYKELESVKSPAEIGIQGRYDDSTVELDEGDEALDMDKETIDRFDNVELEDSCILVLSKEFFSVPTRKSHHRSYKKKIRDAFASRMRTGKKKEYELLAMWYADIDAGADQQRLENAIPSTLFRTLDSKSLPTDDSCGSDWEIL